MSQAETLIERAMDTRYFRTEDGSDPALRAKWIKGQSKLVLLLGPNASGKSFFRRLVGGVLQVDKDEGKESVEFIQLSMEARTGRDIYGPVRAMIYGDEGRDSTGLLSSRLVTMGIKTGSERETPHVVFWDEPDVGLSDEYAVDIGNKIVKFEKSSGDLTRAVFVVTHRRELVRALSRGKPHVLFFGDDPYESLDAWMKRRIKAKDVGDLSEDNRARFQSILKILKG